jgi:hypothetical protein
MCFIPLRCGGIHNEYTKEKNVIGGTNTIAFKLATGWGKNDEVRKKTF